MSLAARGALRPVQQFNTSERGSARDLWPTVFPNAACTTGLIDRLVHHSEIISIEGESYREREAEATKEETVTRRRRRRE